MKSIFIGMLLGIPSAIGIYFLIQKFPSILPFCCGFFVTGRMIGIIQLIRGEN